MLKWNITKAGIAAGVAAMLSVLCAMDVQSGAKKQSTIELVSSVKLAGVQGRIDHLTYDAAHHRLFVAALGNNTVEVVDTGSGKRIKSIAGESEPQGVCWLPEQNVLVVANGDGASVDFFDGSSLARRKRVEGYPDADNVRYDAKDKQVIVGSGTGRLSWFTPDGVESSSVGLPGHPESFQVHPGADRVYVNVPSVNSIFVAEGSTHKIVGQWKLKNAAKNYPMCLNSDGTHAFIACRKPAQIIALDTATGSEISRVDTSGDADDLFYDQPTGRLYESCGAGFIDVFKDEDGHLRLIDRIATASGARTCLLVGALRTLFLAVPQKPNQPCEIRVFKLL